MKNLFAKLEKRGVYSFGRFSIAMVTPPLNITPSALDCGLEALDDAISALEAGV